MVHYIPVGTSEPHDFELRDKGVAIDGTGLSVGLEIKRYSNGEVASVATPPTVAWLNQAAGTVRVTGLENLTEGNYLPRFTLTDGGGKVGFCPNGRHADTWAVVPVHTP